jgi:hypothetical protein
MKPTIQHHRNDIGGGLTSINNRREALALISAIIMMRRLEHLVKWLQVLTSQSLLIATEEPTDVSLGPFVKFTEGELKERCNAVRIRITSLIAELDAIRSVVRQYGEQNFAVSRELLSTGCVDMSLAKKRVAKLEFSVYKNAEELLVRAKIVRTGDRSTNLSSKQFIVLQHGR